MEKFGNLSKAEADCGLLEVLTLVHAAQERFDKWADRLGKGGFYSEYYNYIREASLGLGQMECGIADIVGMKLVYDLESRSESFGDNEILKKNCK